MSDTVWSTPPWSEPQDVQLTKDNKNPLITKYTPAILGYAGLVWSVWIEDNPARRLQYSVLGVDPGVTSDGATLFERGPWSPKQYILDEQASSSPALAALGNTIHLVFPNESGDLVHLQYDNMTDRWGHRCGVMGTTLEAPSLAVYKENLCCMFTDKVSSKLYLVRWTATYGWSKPAEVPDKIPKAIGQRALFELEGKLQLLQTTASSKKIAGFVTSDFKDWTNVEEKVMPNPPSSQLGVNTVCIKGMAFMACTTELKGAGIKQYSAGRWLAADTFKPDPAACPAITIVDNEVLCVYPSADGKCKALIRKALSMPAHNQWMKAIDDDLLLSQLTIPGIHDAAAVSAVPMVGVQKLRIKQHLMTGIRYLDLRAGYRYLTGSQDNDLVAYHQWFPIFDDGTIPTYLRIEDIFKDIAEFLQANKTECVIVQLKQDRGTDTARFARDVKALINKTGKALWRTENTIPKMGQVRGRIQLVRRFPLDLSLPKEDFGIDVSGSLWKENTNSDIPLGTESTSQRVKIQDRFDLADRGGLHDKVVESKFNDVSTFLKEAASDPSKNIWYINFVSAHANKRLLLPHRIALGWEGLDLSKLDVEFAPYSPGMNKMVDTFFNDEVKEPGRYGTILFDYPQEPRELLAAVISMNTNNFKKVPAK